MQDAARELLDMPVGVVLHRVVAFAQAGEVAQGGGSALSVGGGVVDVAFSGGAAAAGEPAGLIPGLQETSHGGAGSAFV
ncbi:hypothetical protein, partial [Microbacterium mangrovi]|uniref:hypothetical protein n=1 Tax=Microbacterium mangrovi TaxID=1348253 RepID=UPI001E58F0A8